MPTPILRPTLGYPQLPLAGLDPCVAPSVATRAGQKPRQSPASLSPRAALRGRARTNMAKAWLVCWTAAAWAQAPEIARNGVVNEASNTPLALADSALARGSRLTIRGARFGSRLPDTSAKLLGPAGAKPLAIIRVDPSTVTARVPDDAPLGPASLTLMELFRAGRFMAELDQRGRLQQGWHYRPDHDVSHAELRLDAGGLHRQR